MCKALMLAFWRNASNLVPRAFPYKGDTCGWLGPRPQGFARVPFVHFQIIDLKLYFRLATLMALSVSFCASLYQLPSRHVPRDEAGMSVLGNTSLLSVLIWWRYIGNINRNQEPIIWWAPVVVYFATMWPYMAAAYKFEFNWIRIFHNKSWVVNFELKRCQSFSCACWHI